MLYSYGHSTENMGKQRAEMFGNALAEIRGYLPYLHVSEGVSKTRDDRFLEEIWQCLYYQELMSGEAASSPLISSWYYVM